MHTRVVQGCTLGSDHIVVGSRRSLQKKLSSCRATGDTCASASLLVPTFFLQYFLLLALSCVAALFRHPAALFAAALIFLAAICFNDPFALALKCGLAAL